MTGTAKPSDRKVKLFVSMVETYYALAVAAGHSKGLTLPLLQISRGYRRHLQILKC